MKIHVSKISPQGIEVKDTISESLIGAREDDNLRFIKPLEVEAKASKVDKTLVVSAKVAGTLAADCGRCLESAEKCWSCEFDLDYEISQNTEFVDITDDVRQEVLLNIPDIVLCKEDCKGLCSRCGVNLNLEECSCKA